MTNIQNSTTIIAEIGCIHIGSLERAKRLALLAKHSGADVLKTQKRNPIESVPKRLHNRPHPNQMFAYGDTYLEHRINVELSKDEHKELKDFCEEIGITYMTSVWDITSAKEISEINTPLIKIPSACNQNYQLLDFVFDHYEKIHISLGMTSIDERNRISDYIHKNKDRPKRSVIYHCTSIYPCPFEKIHLLEISRMKQIYPHVGFSNHGYGIATDIAAMILGAEYIERHFIDDRAFRHTDAAPSLEVAGLEKLCRDIRNVQKTLFYKPDDIDELEAEQRKKLKS